MCRLGTFHGLTPYILRLHIGFPPVLYYSSDCKHSKQLYFDGSGTAHLLEKQASCQKSGSLLKPGDLSIMTGNHGSMGIEPKISAPLYIDPACILNLTKSEAKGNSFFIITSVDVFGTRSGKTAKEAVGFVVVVCGAADAINR